MHKSKILCIFVIFVHSGNSILTNMACTTSDNNTCIDPFCFVTPVSDKINAANFGCGNITRPLNKIYIKQEFYFKLLQNFIPFNIFPVIEYCSFYNNPNVFSFFNAILNVLKEKAPESIKSCPYQGTDLQVKNLTLVTSDLALWITGEYKLVYTFYDDQDPQILQVSAKGEDTWVNIEISFDRK